MERLMETKNFLYAKMICPLCAQTVETEIELALGDTREQRLYTIGDRIIWRRHASVQNGGRPGNGNIDMGGFSYSAACGHRSPVKIIIRGDNIKDVIFDPQQQPGDIPPADYVQQPAQAMPIPQKPFLPNQGKVTFNFDPEWLTEQRQKIVAQLVERGVDIYAPYENARYDEFRIMVPHALHPATYMEIAYLMAQLVDENFREPRVEYVESYPFGVKYRVQKPTA
jgi:hypothetical protein